MAGILVVGSANIDYALGVERLPTPGETVTASGFAQMIGGKGVNQAVAAARAGGKVAMIACVGDDHQGRLLRSALEAEGVDASQVSTAHTSSGVAVVLTASGGDNMIAVSPGANALLLPSMLHAEAFAGRRVVLCQLEIHAATVLRAARLARAAGAAFVLDPAPAQPLSRDLLACVDWLTPNESEARLLLGLPAGDIAPAPAAAALRALGVGGVILKLGARGSLLLAEDGEPIFVAPHEVAAVDTTAAGDAFNGAFAAALAEGASPLEAARFASAASALAVTRPGARDAMPFRPDIERLLSPDGSSVTVAG
jgi:ribokinase